MSRFYGTVDGSAKTQATRRGHESTGLMTYCAAWNGAIRCTAYVKDGNDHVMVEKVTWPEKDFVRVLYDGPFHPSALDVEHERLVESNN